MWLETKEARNFNAVVWVLGEVNGYDQMRLQAVLAPDLLDGGLAQANRPGQAARAPVRGVRRHRALHHRAHLVRPDHRRPPRTWPVAQQAIHAFGDEPTPSATNRSRHRQTARLDLPT